jgi:hypothetical protein
LTFQDPVLRSQPRPGASWSSEPQRAAVCTSTNGVEPTGTDGSLNGDTTIVQMFRLWRRHTELQTVGGVLDGVVAFVTGERRGILIDSGCLICNGGLARV